MNRPFNRDHPHTAYEDVPSHYNNDDVPHVLALLRTFNRFFDDVIENDEQLNEHYTDLYDAYMTMMEHDLQPYAFDLAVSLINLEDEVAKGKAAVRPLRATELPPHLMFVPTVTRQHGERFADAWIKRSFGSGAIMEAFSETGIVAWPEDPDGQGRFHDIEHEILQRITDELRSAAAAAFVKIANEVLTRERRDGTP
ncbi:MAG TPA: hypothetical protein VGO08_03885 [Burkholderiales bacterium]|jgi:hypothetical protein|nr:hypothetical protein [Burkholderiales bacterium]